MYSDISDRKRLEEHQVLLIRELQHRVKNMLASVQAVISSTARSAGTIDAFREALTQRIGSLAKTHELLIESGWRGTSLRDVLYGELRPYDDAAGQRIRLQGPPVHLPPELVAVVGLAVHELTTNAAKHGALAVPGGRVAVTWSLVPENGHRILALEWIERDGLPVQVPTHRGFGSLLLRKVLGRQLNGSVEIDYAPEGLRVHMRAQLPESAGERFLSRAGE
jgi:two-component sensor histidine kinase